MKQLEQTIAELKRRATPAHQAEVKFRLYNIPAPKSSATAIRMMERTQRRLAWIRKYTEPVPSQLSPASLVYSSTSRTKAWLVLLSTYGTVQKFLIKSPSLAVVSSLNVPVSTYLLERRPVGFGVLLTDGAGRAG
jgi:hypothetical protein